MPAMKILVACSIMHIALAVTPVQKAVQMLEGMLEKAKSAKHEENVQFAGFKQFCGDVTVQKQDAIKEADGQIELLKADVEKANSEAERLGDEVVGHEKEITGWEKDGKDATKVREKERATYLEAHADYTESIQAHHVQLPFSSSKTSIVQPRAFCKRCLHFSGLQSMLAKSLKLFWIEQQMIAKMPRMSTIIWVIKKLPTSFSQVR
jgi:hypothetical protein